jgi:hypothetical protein
MSATVQIKDALIRLHAGIKAADGAAISESLGQLDGLLATHRPELDPRLAHFLEGRSYAKALAYLGADSDFGRGATPPGGCAPRR